MNASSFGSPLFFFRHCPLPPTISAKEKEIHSYNLWGSFCSCHLFSFEFASEKVIDLLQLLSVECVWFFFQ